MENLKKSNALKITLIIIGEILLLFLVFSSGVAVGLRKAHFSYKFGEKYERNFMGPRMDMMKDRSPNDFLKMPPDYMKGFVDDFEGRGFRNSHGTFGTIISITDSSLIIKDRDNKENAISITNKTLIKSRRDDLSRSDLKTGDEIAVMGNPNENGTIDAVLIRVFIPIETTN